MDFTELIRGLVRLVTSPTGLYLLFATVGLYSNIMFTTVQERRYPTRWDFYKLGVFLPFVWTMACLVQYHPLISLVIGIVPDRLWQELKRRGVKLTFEAMGQGAALPSETKVKGRVEIEQEGSPTPFEEAHSRRYPRPHPKSGPDRPNADPLEMDVDFEVEVDLPEGFLEQPAPSPRKPRRSQQGARRRKPAARAAAEIEEGRQESERWERQDERF